MHIRFRAEISSVLPSFYSRHYCNCAMREVETLGKPAPLLILTPHRPRTSLDMKYFPPAHLNRSSTTVESLTLSKFCSKIINYGHWQVMNYEVRSIFNVGKISVFLQAYHSCSMAWYKLSAVGRPFHFWTGCHLQLYTYVSSVIIGEVAASRSLVLLCRIWVAGVVKIMSSFSVETQ